LSSRSISIEEAIEQLRLIESQIKQLQSAATEAELRLAQLSSVESALSRLEKGSSDVLIPLDSNATVIVAGTVKPLDKVIVHAGLNVFVEVDLGRALNIVREERASVSKLLDTYSRELAKLTQYYNALQSAIQQALASSMQQGYGRR